MSKTLEVHDSSHGSGLPSYKMLPALVLLLRSRSESSSVWRGLDHRFEGRMQISAARKRGLATPFNPIVKCDKEGLILIFSIKAFGILSRWTTSPVPPFLTEQNSPITSRWSKISQMATSVSSSNAESRYVVHFGGLEI